MSRIFFFSLSLSHWTLSASSKMLHRWRIVSKSGKKKGGGGVPTGSEGEILGWDTTVGSCVWHFK